MCLLWCYHFFFPLNLFISASVKPELRSWLVICCVRVDDNGLDGVVGAFLVADVVFFTDASTFAYAALLAFFLALFFNIPRITLSPHDGLSYLSFAIILPYALSG